MITNTEIMKYLKGATSIKEQMEILQERYDTLSEGSLVIGKYGTEYTQNTNISRPVENEILILLDTLQQFLSLKSKYALLLQERIELIDKALPINSVDNRILKYRFVESLQWKAIANKTFYSVKYLTNIVQPRAIRKISKYLKKDTSSQALIEAYLQGRGTL